MKFVRVYRGCDSNGDGGGGTWGESNFKKKKKTFNPLQELRSVVEWSRQGLLLLYIFNFLFFF